MNAAKLMSYYGVYFIVGLYMVPTGAATQLMLIGMLLALPAILVDKLWSWRQGAPQEQQ